MVVLRFLPQIRLQRGGGHRVVSGQEVCMCVGGAQEVHLQLKKVVNHQIGAWKSIHLGKALSPSSVLHLHNSGCRW